MPQNFNCLALSVLTLAGYLADASPTVLEKRLPTLSSYTYDGCYVDLPTEITRVLPVVGGISARMSLEKCAEACRSYSYFGVEGGSNCFCGNALRAFPFPIQEPVDTLCSIPCSANLAQRCGSVGSLSLYRKNDGAVLPNPPALSYSSIGCYERPNVQGGGLLGEISEWNMDALTLERCGDICAGSNFFAVSGSICDCGNAIQSGVRLKPTADCNVPCGGNSNTICGGNGRSNIYSNIQACGNRGTNLRVQNPGFENGEIGWTPSTVMSTGTIKWTSRKDNANAFQGSRFARIDFYSGALGDFSLAQSVPVCPGTPYIVSASAKGGVSTDACFFQTYLGNSEISDTTVGATYSRYQGYIVPQTSSPTLRLKFTCTNPLTSEDFRQLYLDNAEVRPATPAEVESFTGGNGGGIPGRL